VGTNVHPMLIHVCLGFRLTQLEAIDSLTRKAGCNSRITDSLRKNIKLTRYQSTLFTMYYGEYVAYVKQTRGEAPSIVGAKLPS
jgi:CHAD domain-containing protein